ncbi:hypothetical protein BCV70DRAFT_197332 [Testicularia cyperi]|uniref:Uncharacterized protein n=1 Tax=Testicularia cyperi TaxID=1882483 RepID=A0A317XYT5_9BASI|nr:hypothetical protein BCV70DRAFT_197332 [Testicularia cyperi]
MIGPSRLGPGRSALRSAGTWATTAYQVGECSYRPQHRQSPRSTGGFLTGRDDSAESPRGIRCFSHRSTQSRRQDELAHSQSSNGPHHDTVLHEPPFASASASKVKHLRQLTESASELSPQTGSAHSPHFPSQHHPPDQQPDQHNSSVFPPPFTGNSQYTKQAKSGSNSSEADFGSTVLPSDIQAQLPLRFASAQASSTELELQRWQKPRVPGRLSAYSSAQYSSEDLVEYLTAPNAERFKQIRGKFDAEFHRIDAYLLLRNQDPQSLARLAPRDIVFLIKGVSKYGLGGVLSVLLHDILGSPDAISANLSKSRTGFFQVYQGTQERYDLLKAILSTCSRTELLQHDGLALRLFDHLLQDYREIQAQQALSAEQRQSHSHMQSPSRTDEVEGAAEGASFVVPPSFPQGEGRRLFKSIMHLHQPELAPVLKALVVHLESLTPDFPTAREGSQLIAYYLQPNMRDFAAALDVVRSLRDTEALGQDAIDQSVQDGKSFLSHLRSHLNRDEASPLETPLKTEQDFAAVDGMKDTAQPSTVSGTSQDAPAQALPSSSVSEQLEQICLEVSLRLVVMKCLLSYQPEGGIQFRKAFESMMTSFQLDALQQLPGAASGLDAARRVAFRNVRRIVLSLMGQPNPASLHEVLHILQRTDRRVLAMFESHDLQDYCELALNNKLPQLAIQAYLLVAKAKMSRRLEQGVQSRHAQMLDRNALLVNADTFLTLLDGLNSDQQHISTNALLRGLRLVPLTSASLSQLHVRFRGEQRAHLIAIFADAGLRDEAFDLFEYWSHTRYDLVGQEEAAASPIGHVVVDRSTGRRDGLVQGDRNPVTTSARTLLSLVRSLCRGHASKAEPLNVIGPIKRRNTNNARRVPSKGPKSHSAAVRLRMSQARFVIEVYKRSHMPSDWNHYSLTALARACFHALDIDGAFEALAKISFLRELPDSIDIGVLLNGFMSIDPDRAVELFIQHSTAMESIDGSADRGRKRSSTQGTGADSPSSSTLAGSSQESEAPPPKLAPMKPSPKLVSQLISRAAGQRRFDLVTKLVEFCDSAGLTLSLGRSALMGLLMKNEMEPVAVIRLVRQMRAGGWPLDSNLLDRATRQVLTGNVVRLSEPTDDKIPNSRDLKDLAPLSVVSLQTAIYLTELNMRDKGIVNLETMRLALERIKIQAPSQPSKTKEQLSVKSVPDAEGVTDPTLTQPAFRSTYCDLWIQCLDRLVYAARWTALFDTGSDYRHNMPLWKSSKATRNKLVEVELDDLYEMATSSWQLGHSRKPKRSARGTSALTPTKQEAAWDANFTGPALDAICDGVSRIETPQANVLPPWLYCRFIEAYLALGDANGAAEVAAWMRDEANLDLDSTDEDADRFVQRIKRAVNKQHGGKKKQRAQAKKGNQEASQIFRMLAGQRQTAHTKAWWKP